MDDNKFKKDDFGNKKDDFNRKDNAGSTAHDDKNSGDTGMNARKEGGAEGAGAEASSTDNVKQFLSSKAKNLVEGVESWGDVKEKAGQVVDKARNLASDYAGRAQELSGQAVDQVSGAVRRYPFPAVLVGFGLGAAVGALLSRRR